MGSLSNIIKVSTLGLAGLIGMSNDTADAAEMKSMTENKVWINGSTNNKVHAYIDNSGLSEPTEGADVRFMNTPGFDYVAGSVSLPATNDFFAGKTMFFTILGAPGNGSGRLTNLGQSVPVGTTGYFASWKFNVPSGTTPGQYYFELGLDTSMGGGSPFHTQLEPLIEDTYIPFWVVPNNTIGNTIANSVNTYNLPGQLDAIDSIYGNLGNPAYDLNGDGSTNYFDIDFAHDVTGIVPEPSSLALLAAGLGAFARRRKDDDARGELP